MVGGIPAHVMFDSRATHSFVNPVVASRFVETFSVCEIDVSVSTPGNQTLRAKSVVLSVPVVVQDETFLADLMVIPLERFEIILGMDWLSSH